MKKNVIIIIAVVFLAIFLRLGYGYISGFIKGLAQKNRPAPSVSLYTVSEESIIRTYEAPGRVVSKYRVDVLARISGYLQKSYFKEGDYVRKGQVLFLIEPAEYSNASKMAAADVRNLKAQLDYAEKQLVRAQELVKMDYIAKAKYDQILSQRDSLKAQLAAAQSKYNDSNRNLGYTQVKSPVDGKIGIINVTVGNYVTPSAGALTTIYSTNPIYVTFPLDSADFQALASSDAEQNTDRKVELILTNGSNYSYTGVQDFQDNKVDLSTGTVTLRATFANPNDELINGEFVTAKLYANKPTQVPVVPVTMVMENQAGKYVYKMGENELPELVYIKTTSQNGDNWIVSEGLKKGDKIIAEGLQKVIPGKPVTVVTAEEMKKIKSESTLQDKKNK